MLCIEDQVNAPLYASLYDFYDGNRHQFNAERDPMVLLDSLKDGGGIIIKDPEDKIVASSLLFRYGRKHTETGGTRVLKNGFKLQRVMKWYQTLSEYLFGWPDDHFFAFIAKGNGGSTANIEACGFKEIDMSMNFLTDLGVTTPEQIKEKKGLFTFDLSNISKIANDLLNIHENPVLKNRRTGEEIILKIDGLLLNNQGLLQILNKIKNSNQ